MRIRTIKPEFWSHPVMGRKEDSVRLAAIGLLNMADDEGYFLADPSLVRSTLWPFDDDSTKARRTIAELSSISYIEVRDCGGHGHVGKVVQFSAHQRVDKPKKSGLAQHFESGTPLNPLIPNDSKNDPGRIVDDSTKDRGSVVDQSSREGKGREGKGSGREVVQKPTGGVLRPPPVPEKTSRTAETWASYSSAFVERYAVAPVRNAKVNAQIAQFVERIGAEEAPAVAAFYVTINNAFYVQKGHSVDILLKDAESIRTQWARGRPITRTEADQADKRGARSQAFAPLIEEAKEK